MFDADYRLSDRTAAIQQPVWALETWDVRPAWRGIASWLVFSGMLWAGIAAVLRWALS